MADTTGTISSSQVNQDTTPIDCGLAPATDATDSHTFVCSDNLAGNVVVISYTGAATPELAEVVVVGNPWGE